MSWKPEGGLWHPSPFITSGEFYNRKKYQMGSSDRGCDLDHQQDKVDKYLFYKYAFRFHNLQAHLDTGSKYILY